MLKKNFLTDQKNVNNALMEKPARKEVHCISVIHVKESLQCTQVTVSQIITIRAVVETDSFETKTGFGFGFKTENGKVLDQDRDRKNWRHLGFFDFLKKILRFKFAHKLMVWLYKLSQMTNCFSRSDYVIKHLNDVIFCRFLPKLFFKSTFD